MMMFGIVISSTLVAMPGIGSKTAIALLLPIAFVLNQFEAICLIMSIWAVSNTANSITSILFSVPGGGGSQATIMDGYPMAKNGEAARALSAAFTASAIGGIIGAIVLFAAIPILRPLVLLLGPPEFFMLVMVGIAMVGALSGRAPVKGIIAGAFGLMISMVGVHMITGIHRFTFDQLFLVDGFKLIPVTIGLFAIPEIIYMGVKGTGISDLPLGDLGAGRKQGMKDCITHWWLIVRSSFIGVWVGIIPGLGSAVADWFAYGSAKQTCPGARETFGKGDVRGVIAVDAATNAKEGGSLIPTLAFGIPGSSTLALIFGGLIIVGITPGRDMLTKDLHLTFSMIWLLIIGTIITSILCLLFTRQLAMATKLRPSLMIPCILAMAVIGSFAAASRFEDVLMMLAFGTIGYFMRAAGWPRPPLLLGLVLGPIAERYMWTSVQLYGGEFLLRPGVIIIFLVMVACLAYPMLQDKDTKMHAQETEA
ncbi:MAG: tripartite tricarboxylate transporter permease [Rhodospirillaceae bacterium]|nr:tripartite tricarboxylate transporter permease [Rhodospirillaceae bacterium]